MPLTTSLTLIDLLTEVRAGLDHVTMPTLILYARRDHIVPSLSSLHIYSRIPARHKRLVVFHRSYHGLPMDYDKEQVWQLTTTFIHDYSR